MTTIASQKTTTRALFLDRDGVINHEVDYLWQPEKATFVPGIGSLCRTAKSFGYKIIVVTNQAGIGRGLYSDAQFHAFMDWMRETLLPEGVIFDAVYYCAHHPDHGLGDFKKDCNDRKPNPGMLLRAVRDFGVDLAHSVFVGDRCSDVAAGNAAGIGKMFFMQGTEVTECKGTYTTITSLAAVEEYLRPL